MQSPRGGTYESYNLTGSAVIPFATTALLIAGAAFMIIIRILKNR